MSPVLRILLILVTIIALGVVVRRIRKRKIRVSESVYWVVAAVVLLVLAVFPQIAFFFSRLTGFLSPSNFVFVVLIALMLLKLFDQACDISVLTHKVEVLSQEIALDRHEREQDADKPSKR